MYSDIGVSSSEDEEFPYGPEDLSLDVKLAFNRVCMLIDSLEDTEECMNLLRKIQAEARFIVRQKQIEIAKEKLNETHAMSVPVDPQTRKRNLQTCLFFEGVGSL